MQTIAHNIESQFASRQLNITAGEKRKNSEKLSSGYRINRSADDAAGLQISEKMRWQIRGLNRGEKNTMDGISWVQIGDGAMDEIQSMVHRIRELAIQAANDTNTDSDREAINREILQIKKEINGISTRTQMNTKDIFDNSFAIMDVVGAPQDMQVFDATYNDATGDVTWGGFIFHGERIPWSSVDPNMVQIDPGTGKQVFVGGEYTYADAGTGYTFTISCEDGAEVPTITRTVDMSAGLNGLIIDGALVGWENLVDEDGCPLSDSNVHGGAWSLEYEGTLIGFFVGDVDTVEEIADAIDSCRYGKVIYTWKVGYKGTKEEQAVDADVIKNLQISNGLARSLGSSNEMKYTVRAGDSGIWLENEDGNMVTGSLKSWADMGISSWDSGSDISKDFTYQYSDDEGVNDTFLSFDFTLSDVTSLDSVIDGLDGMEISGKNIRTSYEMIFEHSSDGSVVTAKMAYKKNPPPVSFQEEKQLDRDFDTPEIDNVADANVSYDEILRRAMLEFLDASGNAVISYDCETGKAESELTTDLRTYLNAIINAKRATAMRGGDPQQAQVVTGNLTDLLGKDHITTSGYFSKDLELENDMKFNTPPGFSKGEVGHTYPAAWIDFSGLDEGKFTLDDLIGMGFNSTCKTCDRHYSIVFTDGLPADSETSEQGGYGYYYKAQGYDYVLQIDINSLKQNGVVTAEDLANAIVDVTSDCYDFHYTQYAAKDGTLYIYDDRDNGFDIRKNATFDTAPFYDIDTDEFKFTLETGDGRQIELTYTYDFSDFADNIIVEMTADGDGEYVLLDDGSYVQYNATDHAGMDRYSMSVAYKNCDGSVAATLEDAIDDYVQNAMRKMLEESNIRLSATDFTYMDVQGDEKHNVAVRAVFDSWADETPYENGIHIQNSSNVGDTIIIPRFPLNTVKLHLFGANTSTYDQAQATIGYADYALAYLSAKRSLYGAYQNRMEHIYAISKNTEENTQAAESRLRDMDIADGMVAHSKHSILEQVGQAMLAQANQGKQGVLSLLT